MPVDFSNAGICCRWSLVEKVRWSFSFRLATKQGGVITSYDWSGLRLLGFIRSGGLLDEPRGPVVAEFGTAFSGVTNAWISIDVDGFINFDMPQSAVESGLIAGEAYSLELYAHDSATGERVGQICVGDVYVIGSGN